MPKKTLFLLALIVISLIISCTVNNKCPSCPAGNQQVMEFRNGELPTSSYNGCSDSPIYSSFTNYNYGSCTITALGYYTGASYRTAMYFDVSEIPSTAKVSKAFLSVYSEGGTINGTTVTAYAFNNYWNEGGQCGNVSSDITWANAPALSSTSASKSTLIIPWVTATIEIDAAVVQSWISNPLNNKGFVLKADDESVVNNVVNLDLGDNPTPSFRPKLMVYYTVE